MMKSSCSWFSVKCTGVTPTRADSSELSSTSHVTPTRRSRDWLTSWLSALWYTLTACMPSIDTDSSDADATPPLLLASTLPSSKRTTSSDALVDGINTTRFCMSTCTLGRTSEVEVADLLRMLLATSAWNSEETSWRTEE